MHSGKEQHSHNLHKIVAMLLTLVLAFQGIPCMPVLGVGVADEADISLDNDVVGQSGSVNESDVGVELASDSAVGDGASIDVEAIGETEDGAPRQVNTSVELLDGHIVEFVVERSDGEALPSGVQLLAREMGTHTTSDDTLEAVDVVDDLDTVTWRTVFGRLTGTEDGVNTTYEPCVDLSLVADGHEVEPGGVVRITIRTDAEFLSDGRDYTAVVVSHENRRAIAARALEGCDASELANGLVAPRDFECLTTERTMDEDGATALLCAESQRLGAFCIVGTDRSQTSEAQDDEVTEDQKQGAGMSVTTRSVVGDGTNESDSRSLETTPTADSTKGKLQLQATEETAVVQTAASFNLRCERGSASCTGQVKYVDQFKKQLYGTVTGTKVLTYDTTNPGIPNDTNSFDLYSLKDKLADNYKDDYEFSRVYLSLSGDQKDFRYVCISTDKDIQGSGQTYTRFYTYLNDIKEETRSGGVYYRMWYTLPGSGNNNTNTINVEYNHVREVAFDAVDEADGPVAGAEYALYSDEICYTEYEYKDRSVGATDDSDHVPVTATSGTNGAVSFGKIPYGTYYMKETTVPSGYKDTGSTYKVVVGDTVTLYKATASGYASITDVVHEWSDGSIILNGLESMHITKKWDGDEDYSQHQGFEVEVEVYSQDVVNGKVTLTEAPGSPVTLKNGEWTKTLTGLDPKLSYVVTEKSVKQNGEDCTDDWIPTIEPQQATTKVQYYRASAFKKGEVYVLAVGDGKALCGKDASLGVSSLEANTNIVTGDVTNDMLWKVERINNDGVITLHNLEDNKYLDFVASTWTVTDTTPKFVRHTNSGGDINLYYRENTNASRQYYMTLSNGTISSSTTAPSPALFDIYQKIDVQDINVTVTNRAPTYSVMFRNCAYDTNPLAPVADMRFAVYTEVEYTKYKSGQSAHAVTGADDLKSGADGYMTQGSSGVFSLPTDTYYIVQKEELPGYRSYSPVKFIVTRGGMLWAKQDLPNFEYTTTASAEGSSALVLQVPSFILQTVDVHKVLVDSYDTSSGRTFDFTAMLVDPNENKGIAGWDFGSSMVSDANGEITFGLEHDGSRALTLPVGAKLQVTETTPGYVTKVAENGAAAVRGSTYTNERLGDASLDVTFTNLRAVCKIATNDGEEPFESIGAALDYARAKLPGEPVTIQMLLGTYDMPATDVAVVGENEDVTITTAERAGSSYAGLFPYLGDAGTKAVVRRAKSNTEGSLFIVGNATGKLTLQGIVLDGNNIETNASGGLVRVDAGEFIADAQTVLRNSTVSGSGGALYVAAGATATLDGTQFQGNMATFQGSDVYLEAKGKVLLSGDVCIASTSDEVGALYLAANATGSEIEVIGNLTDGASVHVWAEDTQRDGANMSADETLGITTSTSAVSVSGLDRIVSQRAAGVSAAPGSGNTVVWTIREVVKVTLMVSGAFADTNKEFDITLTIPESTPQVTGSVNKQEQVFVAGENTLRLAHGQELVLNDARAFDTYQIRQTSDQVSSSSTIDMTDGLYDTGVGVETEGAVGTAVLDWDHTDARKFSLSEIRGTKEAPASVLITNYLGDDELPVTGINDGAWTWIGIVVVCACLIGLRWMRRITRA